MNMTIKFENKLMNCQNLLENIFSCNIFYEEIFRFWIIRDNRVILWRVGFQGEKIRLGEIKKNTKINQNWISAWI